MKLIELCPGYWELYDVLCSLEDRQEDGEAIDESRISEAHAKLERHRRTCGECKRP